MSLFAITQQPDFEVYTSPIQRVNDNNALIVVYDRAVILCIIIQNENNFKMLII